MPDCPCCPGTGIEVTLHEPGGWTTLYWCLACVGGGTRTYPPGATVPRAYPRPDSQLRLC